MGRGFEAEGFSVVRGPDLIFGGDIRAFHVPSGRFDGVIAGSPCPDFSRARRAAPTGEGLAMLAEFERVVMEAVPTWWLLENVPGCPDVRIGGYSHQRIDIDARDVGAKQRRLRHFQFGHCDRSLLSLARVVTRPRNGSDAETCLASKSGGRDWGSFCELQGLPHSFDLPGFTLAAKYRAVGNGVHVAVARFIARAVANPAKSGTPLCICGCGRPVAGRQLAAGVGCRKRLQRKRDCAAPEKTGPVTCDGAGAGRDRAVTV